MSTNDIRVMSTGGANALSEETWQTEAAAAAINPGELVKQKSTGSPYAIALVDGDGVIGTTSEIIGLATSAATHTASADGSVRVLRISPNTVLRAKVKTAANADTDAEILALAGDYKVIDVTAGVHTIDAAAAHNLANAFRLTGTGDASASAVDFTVRATALMGPVA